MLATGTPAAMSMLLVLWLLFWGGANPPCAGCSPRGPRSVAHVKAPGQISSRAMIALMPTLVPSQEEGRIYIEELGRIIHRRAGTIRKWESEGKLPKHLLPKRGTRNRRYWSDKQVHGERGIIAWMKRNDMRPGRTVTPPRKHKSHVNHLRRPKYLTKEDIQLVRRWIRTGKTREYILERLLPRTKYVREASLERALEKLAKEQGWKLPKRAPAKITQLDRELDALERKVNKISVKIK